MSEKLVERLKSFIILVIVIASFVAYAITKNDVTAAIGFASSVYAWWRNNNITEAAIAGEKAIKTQKVTKDVNASQNAFVNSANSFSNIR